MAVALLSIVPYLRGNGAFIGDAAVMIPANAALLASREWLAWFGRDFYWGTIAQDVSLYRPLTIVSYLINIRTTGADAFWMLMTNVGLHAAVTMLVLALGTRLVGRAAAVVGALLFAVHPLHTEAVAWIMGRSELLAALLALSACIAWLRAMGPGESRPGWWGAGTTVAFLAALLSKEHVVLLPVWFGLAWGVGRRPRAGGRGAWVGAGVLAALGVFVLLRAAALTRQPTVAATLDLFNPAAVVPAPRRWLTAMAVVGRYAGLFLWPARLSSDYSYAQIEASRGVGGWEAAGLAVAVGFLGAMVIALKRVPGLGLALALAPVTFAVVSNIPFAIGTVMAERLTYLPSAGVCLGAGWAVTRGRLGGWMEQWLEGEGRAPRRWRDWVAAGTIVVAVVALAVRTAVRVGDWADSGTLFASALRVGPRNANMLAAMAKFELSRGRVPEAARLAEDSLRIYPGNVQALLIAAEARAREKDFARALAHYRGASELSPPSAMLRANVGLMLLHLGRLDEAEPELRAAVRLAPTLAAARLGLGALLARSGRIAEASEEYEAARQLRGDDRTPGPGPAAPAPAASTR